MIMINLKEPYLKIYFQTVQYGIVQNKMRPKENFKNKFVKK